MNVEKTSPTFADLADPSQVVVSLSRDFPAGHASPWQRHGRAQIMYARAGVVRLRTHEAAWTVPPRQVAWVPAGVPHELRATGVATVRSLYVDPGAAPGLPADCRVLETSALLRELVARVAQLSPRELREPAGQRLFAVLVDELRARPAVPLELRLPRDPRLQTVTEILLEDPATRLTLPRLARRSDVSERTLARLFSRETGLTFGKWRRRLRLLNAITMLDAGTPVSAVAVDLGYRTPSAFIAMFRQELGTPPARYLRERSAVARVAG